MKSIDLIKYPPSVIKEALRSIIIKQLNRGIAPGNVALRVNPIYVYSWNAQACCQIMRDESERLNYNDQKFDQFRETLLKDFYDVGIYSACYCWLATESDPRIEDFEIPENMWTCINIPDSVSYGLVLKHYSLVMRIAQYAAGLSVEEENSLFRSQDIDHINALAFTNTADICRKNGLNFDQQTLAEKIADIHMI